MTVAQFPTAAEPVWLDAAEAALAGAVSPEEMSAQACRAEIARMERFDARKAARKMALLRRVDEAELATRSGSTSTSDMLSGDFGGDRAS